MGTTPTRTPHPDAARSQSGYSLLEVTIAAMMLLMLSWLVASLSHTGMRSQAFTQRLARVTEITQDVLDQMRTGLTSSVRVFGDDLIGTSYLNLIELPTEMDPPIATTRLPSVRANGMLEPDDPLDPKTGNTLFHARYSWTSEYQTSAGNVYRIDVYRLDWWYMTIAGQGPRAGSPDGLNFARFVSEPLADGTQIDRIGDAADRAEVLAHLYSGSADRFGVTHDPVQVVWNVGEDPALAETLRQIDSLGNLSTSSSAPRDTTWNIVAAPSRCRADILDYRHHSISTVHAPPQMGVGRFGVVDLSSTGFPNGIEVQVVGPSSSRSVLLHLSLVSTRADDHRAYFELHSIADVRDM